MSFKDILSKLDQLSEATKETSTGKVHTADAGGYGRKFDTDEEGDEKKAAKADAPKRGRGRPKKDAGDDGEVKKYDTSALGNVFGGGKKPKKEVGKVSKKHSLKEYFDRIDEMMNQQPVPVMDQGNKQAGVGVVTSKNPAVDKMLSQLSPQDLQVVMKGQPNQPTTPAPAGQKPSATSGGATNQPAMAEDDEDYSAKKARAGKDIGKPGKNFSKIAKDAGKRYGSKEAGKRVAGAILAKLRGLKEGDLPPQDGLMGAGLGAGRSQGVTEAAKPDFIDLDKDGNKKETMKKAAQDKKAKKKVDESMDNRLKAAHHAGKSHALSKQGYNCHYDDMEEARMYHEGFKEGLDECYGQVPIQGLKVADEGAQGTVDDMASFGAHTPAMEDEMEEGNAFTRALAKTPQGGKFSVGGKTFTDHSGYDAKVFESWDNQLGSLLEEFQEIQEGISVSVSKGQQGSPDSVSVTAQDGDADKLLALVKSAGLGLFGDEHQPGDMGVQAGGEQHGGVDVVGDHDGMMALIKKASGGGQPGTLEPASAGSEDYADEEGEEGQEDDGGLDIIKQLTQAIGGGSEKGHEEVDEEGGHIGGPSDETDEEYMNQEEYEVAEDNAPDTGAAEFQAMDQEVAQDNAAASSHGGAVNSNLEEADDEEEDMCETCNESPCSCDHDDEEEDLEESYANSDDDQFEADIDFMTKMISGGLNKQKSTGQTTIPVIAGQNDREGYSVQESITDWKKLAGLK